MPLKGVKVLDLSRLLPGPYCTMILADFGAEVIKVEEPGIGDYIRHFEPKRDENSAVYHSLNNNKKSICLDLKDREERSHFLKLVEEADVIVESFRPGVMKRLGLDYAELEKLNPRLIYCAITGYGQTGPYAEMPGHDINYMSYAGLLDLMGERGSKPIVPTAQIADIGGGAMPAVIGILLALLERSKSGEGQMVDISMLDGVISWLHLLLPQHYAGQEIKRGEALLNGGFACYQVYETYDQRHISVGALEPKFWQVFCEGIGKPEFIALQEAPGEEQESLIKEVQEVIKQKTLEQWMEIFSDGEACVAPILKLEELDQDPQIAERQMLECLKEERDSGFKEINSAIKLSATPAVPKRRAPALGEHTEEILNSLTNAASTNNAIT
ncbi:CoA transferase [Sporosarcina luteola]|uniref:CaiB/BaiF CoA transferase family protein n=1 Tax=Sporosarcina luteola TaxID=582850 RepID=UPI00203E2DDB|nr:CaiB/BaiF CoA-transferase family protein [Sporosarcina luteola]MCM3743188.1 CoA transferase [Sporosarcina luteola]